VRLYDARVRIRGLTLNPRGSAGASIGLTPPFIAGGGGGYGGGLGGGGLSG